MAEFSSAVYPGKVFAAEVEGIVEATGESQGNLIGRGNQCPSDDRGKYCK